MLTMSLAHGFISTAQNDTYGICSGHKQLYKHKLEIIKDEKSNKLIFMELLYL